ncbi:MAG: DUF2141 domain-containing protein [Chlorobiaceae bacterium]
MKKLLALFAMLSFVTIKPLLAENAVTLICVPGQTGCITVHVKGLKNSNGMLGIALYTAKKGFPDKPEYAFATLVNKCSSSSNEAAFKNIPYGTYAVSVLHDENSNGKMDKTFIGIPKEGFGVSNNPKIRRGPPSFDEALFSFNSQQLDLTIEMNYF